MFKVQLQKLDPEMPQTQKKEVSTIMRKKRKQDKEKMYQRVHRKDMTTGFNLLKKWVSGTEKLNRSDILMETVNYIKELLNKVKGLEKESPMECTPQTPTVMERDSVQDCTDSAPREPLMPHRSLTDLDTGLISYSSEMIDGTVVVSTPMEIEASEEIPESDILSLEEELLASPDEDELLVSPEEEMELLASRDEVELPEFNWIEDLRQWLEL
jgi:hypothetical protein